MTINLNSQNDRKIKSIESRNPLKMGVNFGLSRVLNETQLPLICDSDSCGFFKNGQADGIYLGLNFDYSFNSFFSLNLRTSFDSRPVNLLGFRDTDTIYFESTDSYNSANLEYQYEGVVNYFSVDLGIRLQPIESIPLSFRAGFDFSSPLFKAEFKNTRKAADNNFLINGKRVETIAEGEIENITNNQGITLGLLYDIDIPGGLVLTPEFIYRHQFNSSITGSDWFTTIYKAGLTISWNIISEEKIIYEEVEISEDYVRDTLLDETVEEIIPPDDTLLRKPDKAVDSIPDISINIVQTTVTETYPILPYIFFDEKKSIIHDRYLDRRFENIAENELPKNSVEIYQNLLPIIGKRMKNSNAILKIYGYSDGREFNDSLSQENIAKQRAENIKSYFIRKWGITSDRLVIEYATLPNKPTNMKYNEGYEENRRVELYSDDIEIFKPVVHSKFLEFHSEKKELVFRPIIENNDLVQSYSFSIISDGEQRENITNINKLPDKIEFMLNDELINSIGHSDILTAQLIVNRLDGKTEIVESNIEVNKETNQFELGRLNLIVFDFDNAIISKENKEMIKEFAVKGIKDNSITVISGSTDNLGEKIYNKELSLKRAENVAKFINELIPDYKINNIIGLGADNLKFDNSTPEGRFYCRTVLIEVKTPISN